MKAVVIGGGTGAPVSIKVLRALDIETNAVVAMADDGGSSGRLRAHTGKVPPGDVRKCLVAMAREPQGPWARAFSERFEYANSHALGNIILLALEGVTHSFARAIRMCEDLLEAQGHVYPSTLENVILTGVTRDGRCIDGQSAICKSQTALAHVHLTPFSPKPNQEAIDAILAADLIVLGPGSLFTSIIPNILVPGVRDALRASRACKVFVCSLGDMQGETWGLTAFEHVEALLDHGLRGALDVVIVHSDEKGSSFDGAEQMSPGATTCVFRAVCQEDLASGTAQGSVAGFAGSTPGTTQGSAPDLAHRYSIRSVVCTEKDIERIQQAGPLLIVRDLRDPSRPTWHDRGKLAEALKGVIQACHS